MPTWTSKARVLAAIHRQVPDRVPLNYSSNPASDARLKRHFGLAPDDAEGLRRALRIDFRGVWPAYTGPRLHADIPARGVVVDDWGIHRRRIEHETGAYWDYCDFPLREATEEEVAAWPLPNPDHFDTSRIADTCRQLSDYAIFCGGPGVGDVINSTGMLRSMEQTLIDLITDDPAGLLLIRRRADIYLKLMERVLDAGRGGIDLMWLGEDLGTQKAPMISLELYRRHIRPIHQAFIDLAKSYGIPVIVHTCGSSSWAYDDFIAMGVSAVDTLQPEAANMAPATLKARFGNRLAFHGCISTAGPLATGSADDVRAVCRDTLDIMMPGGGYCLAPTHSSQDNTPLENVLAMYETGLSHGVYA